MLFAVVAFRGATLVDGTGAAARENALLVVENGRIVSVGPSSPAALAALPPGAEVRDVSGRWIVPGLIDAHVHAESDADLKQMLRWGVTTVRLMAEDARAARALADRSSKSDAIPDVFPAAPIFTAPGGWWDQGEPPDASLDRTPGDPEAAGRAVRTAKELGAREIKLMLDDMGWCRDPTPRLPRMTPAVADAILSRSAALGMRASVHAPNLADARAAVAGGATLLAHGVLDRFDEPTVARMKSRPVYYVPTMDVFEFLADTRAFVDAVLRDPLVTRPGGLPAETVTRYRSKEYSDGYRRRYPNFENIRRKLPVLRENLRRLHAAGVPVALGTDMWAFPGLGASIELDLFVKAGLTPLEALRAATQTSARSLAIGEDRGTLEPGKRADFLVLSGDPLADVLNVRKIVDVYKRGQRVAPPAAGPPDR
ncbi:MAG TPA: amidohydrolase family protein [Thermoanaerobaculia bacterium]|nr:amidohydrolase family protein [Thermoanaerobaculia bacterium]